MSEVRRGEVRAGLAPGSNAAFGFERRTLDCRCADLAALSAKAALFASATARGLSFAA
jgi:hypothetical protein